MDGMEYVPLYMFYLVGFENLTTPASGKQLNFVELKKKRKNITTAHYGMRLHSKGGSWNIRNVLLPNSVWHFATRRLNRACFLLLHSLAPLTTTFQAEDYNVWGEFMVSFVSNKVQKQKYDNNKIEKFVSILSWICFDSVCFLLANL